MLLEKKLVMMLGKEDVLHLRSRSVKRMLWPVDHEQIKNELRREQQAADKEFTERYNFDFKTGQPLHGKYKWVSIDSELPSDNECGTTTKQNTCPSGSNERFTRSPVATECSPSKRSTSENSQSETTKRMKRDSIISSESTSKLKGRQKSSKKIGK